MTTPTLESPNVGNLQVGKGIVSFKKTGSSVFRDLGNVTSLAITPNLTTLEHFSSRLGVKSKDLTIVLEKKCSVKLVMEEITAENVALMLLGNLDETVVGGPEVEIFGQSSVTGELQFVGTNDVGPQCTVNLYNVSFTPSGDFSVISDEFNNMEATADVLVATSGTNVGKFGKVKFTNVASETVIPTVTSVTPNTGVAAGGLAVTIAGTHFVDVSDVTFGGVSATSIIEVSSTSITCKTPPHAVGAVTVQVVAAGGTGSLSTAFTYT
jgi:hypothetical protein